MKIEIMKALKEIIEREIKKCNETKTVPSRELLDTISLFNILINN